MFGVAQAAPDGLDPEQVIVLETVGSVADFQSVVRKIDGLEWLGDFDVDVMAGDPGFLDDGTDPERTPARVFVMASNQTAYAKLLALWKAWVAAPNDKLERGYGGLAEAFRYLNDVRVWGSRDRVLYTGVRGFWEAGLGTGSPTLRFETELWCRQVEAARNAAYERLSDAVTEAGGQCLRQAVLPEIDYHGVLIELPAPAVQAAVDALNQDGNTRLLRLTDVKYYAPLGQAAISSVGEAAQTAPPNRPLPQAPPVVAILDGVPLANHVALQGRLQLDDPDNLAGSYNAGEHRHGTAMASLVAHGEYDGNGEAISSRIYVRPVMVPGAPDLNNVRWETFPPGELAVDIVHRAVVRMFEPVGATAAQAPTVKVINLSLGDRWQPFDRHLSPWARLLDWLSWRFQVLFVVSSGNHGNDITISAAPQAVGALTDEELQSHTLRAMARQRLDRRLLAPAEAVNALTVGAYHGQETAHGNAGTLVDLLRGAALTSPTGTVASGYRRSVKPDILMAGGRQFYRSPLPLPGAVTSQFQLPNTIAQPGQLVAACHPAGLSNAYAARSTGSSNAAALTTRRAVFLSTELEALRREPGGGQLTDSYEAVVLKALIAHGADWGDRETLFDRVFDGPDDGMERWWRIKRACSQFLGYGVPDFERGTVCSDQRVIALGIGSIAANEGHVFELPLPPALSAQRIRRRLAVTLAWLTPVNPRHRAYRAADLWFVPPVDALALKRVNTDHDTVTRGTLQHEVLEGEDAIPIVAGDVLPVQVNCRAEAAARLNTAIPYCLVVSLETAQPLAVSVYDQVKTAVDALHAPIMVGAPVGGA